VLTCQQVTELAADLGGGLRGIRQLQFWLHVAMCRHCRHYLAHLRATVRLLRQLPSGLPPAEDEENLLLAFERRTNPDAVSPGEFSSEEATWKRRPQ
jgi:hypothetical protein